jgi:hypothetical protein
MTIVPDAPARKGLMAEKKPDFTRPVFARRTVAGHNRRRS